MDVCSPLIFLGMRGFFVAYFVKAVSLHNFLNDIHNKDFSDV